ncbi:MAG TPA: hypothetical protein VEZ90_01440, partial [Blastocatellia bacterium]|nr:hypothetical protein [Blastocatellia bacterium]
MIDAQPLAAVQKLGGKSFRRAGARIILALASAIYLAPQTLAGLRVTETAGGITTPGERTSLGAAGQTQPDT